MAFGSTTRSCRRYLVGLSPVVHTVRRETIKVGNTTTLAGRSASLKPGGRTDGVLTMPLPPEDASLLDVRMSWSPEDASLWEQPALALRISL
jgi:hypothetical protein